MIMSWMEKVDELLSWLPGGPTAISYYEDLLLPRTQKVEELIKAAQSGSFPTIGTILYPAIIVAAMFGVLRTILTATAFEVSSVIVAQYVNDSDSKSTSLRHLMQLIQNYFLLCSFNLHTLPIQFNLPSSLTK